MTATIDEQITNILTSTRRIAVVGASVNPERPSNQVMQVLMAHGYQVVPVNPGLAGQTILGQMVYARLADVPGPIDMVDIFRANDAAGDVTLEAIALKDQLTIKTVWMQLGVVNEAAATAARAAGIAVVVDRCPAIEIRRLHVAVVA
jgi:uncharacterized protein